MQVFSQVYYFFISIVMAICLALDIPMKAIGPKINLSGYTLVWNDEFDGDALDQTKWRGHNHDLTGALTKAYDGCYYTSDCIRVENGNLILSVRREDGADPARPAGWYCASIDSYPSFFGTYGYFECRAKLAKAVAGNCAFWLNSPASYDTSLSKEAGAEIDIMESMRYGVAHEGSVENNIHYFDEGGHRFLHARWVIVGGNPYEEFNTYGVKWTESGYTFYVNGKECRSSDFGVSQSPEYIVLSNFMRNFKTQSIEGGSADFVVDYVRVYQAK